MSHLGEYDSVTDSPIHRVDAPEKVTGTAKYTVDTVFEGQLEGQILRSAGKNWPDAECIRTDAH